MTELAVAFAWAWGVPDWVAGNALGMSENAVRRMRRGMGLVKGGRGCPKANARSPARERALKDSNKDRANVCTK